MSERQAAPVWRCLLVWAAATSALATCTVLGALEAAALPRSPAPTFDEALVSLAAVTSLVACPWLWVLTSWGVLDALRGRTSAAHTGWWRRVTMAACGCAATVAVALPAHAQPGGPAEPSGALPSTPVHVLDGLPYPERPALAAPPARRAAVPTGRTTAEPDTPGHHVVRPGDTLWALAADQVRSSGGEPDVATVARAVADLHHANREVVGDDPDLILPGQRLTLDQTRTTHREDPR